MRPVQSLAASMIITLAVGLSATGCGGGEGEGHVLLGDRTEAVLDHGEVLPAPGKIEGAIRGCETAARGARGPGGLTVDYPQDRSIFPPDFVPPTFLWHDAAGESDCWLVRIEFPTEPALAPEAPPISVLVPRAPPDFGEPDPRAWFPTNAPYEPTEYQRTAIAWTPGEELWAEIRRRTHAGRSSAILTFDGFDADDTGTPLSRGRVEIEISTDPVGAPLFYRDVPLAAAIGEDGVIKPLGDKALPLIAWRLRDLSRPASKVVLTGMSSCGNCHSFSLDGETLGMDVDGPAGDKGMYAIKPISQNMVIGRDDVITWNSFSKDPQEQRTIGFLSRISPDGQTVVSTVNESLYTRNFKDYRFLQVFYPTRGILAWWSRETGEIRALPGADDPDYVHCDPAWTPDGKHLIFARAPASDPYAAGVPPAEYPNDPNETAIRYDLYRIPFNEGRGGTPEPVVGASKTRMSNSFPKISPDGKWLVYVRCRNGQLMRPDGRLIIVPAEGGEAREMRCNMEVMNSWHSFSPNSRWMVFSSKQNTPYTQAFLTHLDEEGHASPAILVPNCTASNRAVNIPEFLNAPYDALDSIAVPVVDHQVHYLRAETSHDEGDLEETVAHLEEALRLDPEFTRSQMLMGYTLRDLGRGEEAIPYFEKAMDQMVQPANFVADLGFLYLDTGQPEKAVPVFERAIRARRTYPNSWFGLARALRTLGRHAEVLDCLERANRAISRIPLLRAELALELATSPEESLRDGPRALGLAEEAVRETEGDQPVLLEALAASLAAVERYDEAVATATRALDLARGTDAQLAREIAAHLEAYRLGQPFRRE